LKDEKDFFAGLVFAVAGGAFAWGAGNYSLGSSGRMGPGFFPLLLGILLALLGSVMMARALLLHNERAERIGVLAWKPLVFIISANLIFGVAIGGLPVIGLPPLGLMVGIYLLTLVACAAGERFDLKEALVLGTALCALSYVAFVLLLKLQFPVWPAFFVE